jgi:hypothetical protein
MFFSIIARLYLMERWIGRQGKKIFDVVVPSDPCKKPPLAKAHPLQKPTPCKKPTFSQVRG